MLLRVLIVYGLLLLHRISIVDGRAAAAYPIYDDPRSAHSAFKSQPSQQASARLSLAAAAAASKSRHSNKTAMAVKVDHKGKYPSLNPRWVKQGMQLRPLLSDFVRVRELGHGSYGRVELAMLPDEPRQYAIKTVMRRKIVDGVEDLSWGEKHAELLHNEVKALKSFTSPFTIQMYFLYSSHTKHYFVEEFVESDDLKALLLSKPNHRFEPADVRIYMAEMLEGLAHMHEKGWIYRDLKTDNTLIARDGHLKLADYGFAKQTRRPGAHHDKSSATVLGTPQNMAPEIDYHKKRHEYADKHPKQSRHDPIYGKHSVGKKLPRSYHQEVDYFALGCVFFEMLLGRKPFTTPSKTSLDARKLIHRGNYHIPQQLPPTERSLMRGLLAYNPVRRLGRKGPNQVKEHPYFSRHPELGAIDWDRLRKREYPAPYTYENGLYKHMTGSAKDSFPRIQRHP